MTSALAALLACAGQTVLYAQDPIIQTKYTADPAPMVYNDTVFLYTSHDEDDAQGYGFKMLDWQLYTSTDMVNWTDHGPIASLKDFTWRKRDNGAWALQVVERNGKFYMYCPLHGNGIGVLVSDSPYGPFKDPIGKPLVWQKEHWDDIDPTVYIDDDGQAYMYWGNPNLYYVKLNEDMISTSGDIVKIGKLNEGGEVGQVDTVFPAGNTAVGHAHDFSQVFLGELALLAELLQESADFLLIHWIHPPYSCMIPQPKQKTP